jgi:hypothetical protein
MKTYKGLRDLLAALVLSLLWTTPAQAPENSQSDARLAW